VLRVEEVGDYAQEDKRQALQDYLAPFALPTFFRAGKEVSVPDWAKRVLGELSNVFNAAFAASINRERRSRTWVIKTKTGEWALDPQPFSRAGGAGCHRG
jgi:hypothetical protein